MICIQMASLGVYAFYCLPIAFYCFGPPPLPFYPETAHWSYFWPEGSSQAPPEMILHPQHVLQTSSWVLWISKFCRFYPYTHASNVTENAAPSLPCPKACQSKDRCHIIMQRGSEVKWYWTEALFSFLALEFLPKISKLDFSFKSIRPMNSKSLKQVNTGYVFHSALVKKKFL